MLTELMILYLVVLARRALFRTIGRTLRLIWRGSGVLAGALNTTHDKWQRQAQIERSGNVVPFRRPYRTR